jgi:deoxyadenosine/deoxycytidine kinase
MEVAIEGIIGCGKSTLLKALEDEGYTVVREDIEQWTELLNLFYSDQKRWSLTLQTKIFMHFVKRKSEPFHGVRIWERSTLSNIKVFYSMLRGAGMINPAEQAVFESLVEQLDWSPDKVIYLRVPVENAMERMEKRRCKEDEGVTLDYQRALYQKHEEVMKGCNALIIDGTGTIEETIESLKPLLN